MAIAIFSGKQNSNRMACKISHALLTLAFLLTGIGTAFSQAEQLPPSKKDMMDSAPLTIADGCEAYVTISGKYRLESSKIAVIKRKTYQYSLQFTVDSDKTLGTIYSQNGERFAKGDELMFMNFLAERKSFRIQETAADGTSATFPLDESELKWLASSQVETVFLKKDSANQLLKYSLDEESKTRLDNTLECLLKMK